MCFFFFVKREKEAFLERFQEKERQKAIRGTARALLSRPFRAYQREDESKPSEKRERQKEHKTCDSTYYLTNIVHKRLIFDY
jgi:hypothetical protein